MQIKISARHGNLSDRSQEAITSKVEKLSRLFDRLTEIVVTVDLEQKGRPKVDIHVSAEHKKDFNASDQADDLLGAVDAVVHKLERQLRKYKEKLQERHPH